MPLWYKNIEKRVEELQHRHHGANEMCWGADSSHSSLRLSDSRQINQMESVRFGKYYNQEECWVLSLFYGQMLTKSSQVSQLEK